MQFFIISDHELIRSTIRHTLKRLKGISSVVQFNSIKDSDKLKIKTQIIRSEGSIFILDLDWKLSVRYKNTHYRVVLLHIVTLLSKELDCRLLLIGSEQAIADHHTFIADANILPAQVLFKPFNLLQLEEFVLYNLQQSHDETYRYG